jgi:hypothetical protein
MCSSQYVHGPVNSAGVQILCDPVQYAALEEEAAATKQSAAAIVREAVADRLDRRERSKPSNAWSPALKRRRAGAA